MGQLIRRCQHPNRLATIRSGARRIVPQRSPCEVICGREIL